MLHRHVEPFLLPQKDNEDTQEKSTVHGPGVNQSHAELLFAIASAMRSHDSETIEKAVEAAERAMADVPLRAVESFWDVCNAEVLQQLSENDSRFGDSPNRHALVAPTLGATQIEVKTTKGETAQSRAPIAGGAAVKGRQQSRALPAQSIDTEMQTVPCVSAPWLEAPRVGRSLAEEFTMRGSQSPSPRR